MATTNITIPARSASGPEGKHAPARMKFYVDTKRCIECGGCEVACKNENNGERFFPLSTLPSLSRVTLPSLPRATLPSLPRV